MINKAPLPPSKYLPAFLLTLFFTFQRPHLNDIAPATDLPYSFEFHLQSDPYTIYLPTRKRPPRLKNPKMRPKRRRSADLSSKPLRSKDHLWIAC